MALIIPPLRGATYLRVDGLRVDLNPERRALGEYTVPAHRTCEVHLYAYADAAARSAKAAPVWDAPLQFTLGDLGFAMQTVPGTAILAGGPCQNAPAITPGQLWSAIYAMVTRFYPGGAVDSQPRGIEAGLVSG